MFSLTGKYHSNILIPFLKLLGVPYTESYARKLYNEHPHKYNMYGLSGMLTEYGIENAGVEVDDKATDIFSLPIPFIAFAGNDFVTVKGVTKQDVTFISNSREVVAPIEQFIQMWSGIALLAEKNAGSKEKGYAENRTHERISGAEQIALGVLTVVLLAYMLYFNRSLAYSGMIFLLLTNLVGVYVTYLLVQKQLHLESGYADKICSLFSRSDCNSVLEGEAGKLFGLFGWSEIGFSFFLSNLLLIVLTPQLITYQALITVCALPYSFWSVWYQKYRAKQWCPLCLIVQGLFWGLVLIHGFSGTISIPAFSLSELLGVACLYLAPFLIIRVLLPKLTVSGQIETIRQEINSIKASEDIFSILLKQQPYIPTPMDVSSICFGNREARNRITILTNPHCNPCAKLHKEVDQLLEKSGGEICVQYLFASFQGLEDSARFLIGSYLFEKDSAKVQQLYSEWYASGKNNKEAFMRNHPVLMNPDVVEKEYASHQQWSLKNQLRATPTVFFNGYRLPENYQLVDLAYFIDLEVNTKYSLQEVGQ